MKTEENSIWALYVADAAHVLHEIEGSLLALEGDTTLTAELNRLYRALHTLKGNSAMLELSRMEALAHGAEDVVEVVRGDAGASLDRATVDLLLGTVDVLRTQIERASNTRQDADEQVVNSALAGVHAWLSSHGVAPREPAQPRAKDAADGGVFLFSDAPASVPEHAPVDPKAESDADTIGVFLALARALCMPHAVLLSSAGELHELVETLRPAAQRLGYAAITAALDRLASDAAMAPQEPVDPSRLRALCLALTELEVHYCGLDAQLERFGFADLLERVSTARAAPKQPVVAPPGAASPAPRPGTDDHPQRRRDDASDFLRVDARRISFVMDLAGEVGLACSAVTHHPDLQGKELEGFSAAAHKLEVLVRELQNEVSAMRLVRIATVFQSMKRVVRDAAHRTGKQVELLISGDETEIDKLTVDALHDPLVHLLRNAIDHGIEAPLQRARTGKPSIGRIVLEASHQGGEVMVQVSDDGGGLNPERIVARAIERGLVPRGAKLTEDQILDLVMLPGFSTKEQADELSGRGVGMDVIKTAIDALRGRVRLQSSEGKGLRVALTVPLTMAFLDAMVVADRGGLYAVPIEKVCEVFKVEAHQVHQNSADGRTMLMVRDELVPILRLADYYGEHSVAAGELPGSIVVVVQTSRGTLALPVDSLLGNQPVMLKPMKGVIAKVRAAAGCGMLRSGDVALTLDCEQLRV